MSDVKDILGVRGSGHEGKAEKPEKEKVVRPKVRAKPAPGLPR